MATRAVNDPDEYRPKHFAHTRTRAMVDEIELPQTSRTIRRLPRLVRGAASLAYRAGRRRLVAALVLQVAGSAVLAVQLLATKSLISELIADRRSGHFSSTVPALVVVVAAVGASGALQVIRLELQRVLSELVSQYTLSRVLEAATEVDLIQFEDAGFHDRLQRATINASMRPLQMTTGILSVISSMVSSAAIAATLLVIQPLVLCLAVVAILPLGIVNVWVGRSFYEFAVTQTPLDRRRMYLQSLLVTKEPAKEVRSYQLSSYLRDEWQRLYDMRLSALRDLARSRSVQGVAASILTMVILGGTLGVLVLFVSDGRMSIAGAATAAGALLLLGTQLNSLAGGLGNLFESALFIEDFNTFVEPIAASRPRPAAPSGPSAGLSESPRIDVRGVSFTYPSRPESSLTDVDMTIAPGQIVALVGENGSGKTTLAKLLASLYEPERGRITWDGLDLRDLGEELVRSRVAVLFQDFARFMMSARVNVEMGRWESMGDDHRFHQAAHRAGAAGILDGLPSRADTLLGPEFFGGSDLSGGQWQRIALARAFFRDAALIILDEPTASLDPRAEADLFAAVRKLFAGKSVLLISHRFASVRLADHIYVLSGGRVAEHGSHPDLMAEGGLYAELFTLQAAAFGLTSKMETV